MRSSDLHYLTGASCARKVNAISFSKSQNCEKSEVICMKLHKFYILHVFKLMSNTAHIGEYV